MSARRKNSLNRQVRRVYCQDELARICTLPEDEFGTAFGMRTVKVEQRGWTPKNYRDDSACDYYHFRDNGASVLAVAHLDTVVLPGGRVPHFRITQQGGPLITSGALDDRLGAYVILGMLPKLGITCDWLLTVGEETGQSTASLFTPEKKYDHVIEFDRGGTDVVMYQYDDAATRQAVRAAGAVVGNGIFSDIGYLEHLGVKAFNWGVGYRGNYHSERGYAYLWDTFSMVAKYLRFHAQNAGTAMPHEPEWAGSSYRTSSTGYRYDGRYNGAPDCDTCCAIASVDIDTMICAACGACYDCGYDQYDCTCFTDREKDDAAYEKWLADRAARKAEDAEAAEAISRVDITDADRAAAARKIREELAIKTVLPPWSATGPWSPGEPAGNELAAAPARKELTAGNGHHPVGHLGNAGPASTAGPTIAERSVMNWR